MAAANGNWDIAPNETRTWNGLYALTRLSRGAGELAQECDSAETDAGQQQDEALRDFFMEAQGQLKALVKKAEVLAQARRDSGEHRGRDQVQEASMESFPASDPPSY